MKLLAKLNRMFVILAAVCALTVFTTGCETVGGGGSHTLDELKAAANDGDANASLKLGNAYFNGRNGAEKDFVEAQKWYEKAAQQFKTK
ncbi:MAG: hypothetical protein CMO80_04640 [Verrucomicrobiales bacterium]|nr:hypothetical protein [Verrucomicrobiales bacterium]|tara:strand:- start:6688 stop:6954 length:267 start_codon:yes stop_codon:yes gene_type:complete